MKVRSLCRAAWEKQFGAVPCCPGEALSNGAFVGRFLRRERGSDFQAAKFFGTDDAWAEQIRQAATPAKAKSMGRSREHPIRRDWEQAKDDVMRTSRAAEVRDARRAAGAVAGDRRRGVGRGLAERLLLGTGAKRDGKNMLGRILMEVREELRPRHLNQIRRCLAIGAPAFPARGALSQPRLLHTRIGRFHRLAQARSPSIRRRWGRPNARQNESESTRRNAARPLRRRGHSGLSARWFGGCK